MTTITTTGDHMPTHDPRLAAKMYRDTKERIVALVTGLDDERVHAAVQSCPGWSVRDVLAHMTAVAEDWEQTHLAAPPTAEETAAHVARFQGRRLAEILTAWTVATARLGRLAESAGIEPPVGDAASHEHDIRDALDRPGGRDSDAVRYTSDRLLAMLDTPAAMRVSVEDADYRCGPEGTASEICLRTTRFEAMRWRTGRRSRAQLLRMDWSADPAPVLDHLYLFGPADRDVIE